MNKTKIIVVEDNIVYCEYVCNMLSREGYRNMKAYHLSTAKKHLQQATDNDIVVADLRLPDGSGIDLLCWMRKEGKMQPFIIMTDYAEVNTAVESMKLGSIDYIPKQLVEDKLAEKEVHEIPPCVLVQFVVQSSESFKIAVDVRFHHIHEDVVHLVISALLRCRLAVSFCHVGKG